VSRTGSFPSRRSAPPKIPSARAGFRQTLGGHWTIGIPQKQNFLDVADGEAAILELPHERMRFQDGVVVDAMSTLGTSG